MSAIGELRAAARRIAELERQLEKATGEEELQLERLLLDAEADEAEAQSLARWESEDD